MFKKLSASLLALALVAGLAAPAGAAGAGGSFVIKQVYLRADGSVAMISGDGTNKNPDGCTGGTGLYVIERAAIGAEAFDRLVAQMTAAHLANRRAEVWLSGCSTGTYWGGTRPLIWDFRINLD